MRVFSMCLMILVACDESPASVDAVGDSVGDASSEDTSVGDTSALDVPETDDTDTADTDTADTTGDTDTGDTDTGGADSDADLDADAESDTDTRDGHDGDTQSSEPTPCADVAACLAAAGLTCGENELAPWTLAQTPGGSTLALRMLEGELFCACQGLALPTAQDYAQWAQREGAVGVVDGPGTGVLEVEFTYYWKQYAPNTGVYEQGRFYYDGDGLEDPFGSAIEDPVYGGTRPLLTSSQFVMGEVNNSIQFRLSSSFLPDQFGQGSRADYGHLMCAPKTRFNDISQVLWDPIEYPGSTVLEGGETCTNAAPLTAGTTITGSLLGRTNDHVFTDRDGCEYTLGTSPDVVYSIAVPAGKTLTASLRTDDSWGILQLVDETDHCRDLGRCLAATEALFATESLSWTNGSSPNTVLLVVTGSRDASFNFELSTSIE